MPTRKLTNESARLQESGHPQTPWKKWGPYLSERQWGTVREDYSENGDAWNSFSHDQARSRAYRWGEDGLGGISDEKQRLCFALALWNHHDPILKERLFGLTNSEGNHGEDVKEYYFYLNSTPTHSYMQYLYKYPQRAYPYAELVKTNQQRSRQQMEYELLDTGIFNDHRYFDVFLEYAKSSPESILIQITAINRGPEASMVHLLPTLWFRNYWTGWSAPPPHKPLLKAIDESASGIALVQATHPELGSYYLVCDQKVPLLFTENETNRAKLHLDGAAASPYFKDGINQYLVEGLENAVNPHQIGTKVSAHYHLTIPPGQSAVVRLRLTHVLQETQNDPFGTSFQELFGSRRQEADEFYQSITPPALGADAALVMRQALAGMLWSKQYYYLDADKWLLEHHAHPLHNRKPTSRNWQWFHMINDDIISMPDKWEYPWYAAWDLAFHTIPLSMVDIDFAKEQMLLMLKGHYLHPNGQIPAYEWNFSDVNPPVHAWATIFIYRSEQAALGQGDLHFLKSCLNKLLLNFTWWVNRKDRFGKNVFEGGFLGLDNIGVFDRSSPLPTGGYLEQADGTAWMALFTQNILEIVCELALYDRSYESMIFKFTDHFLYIAAAMNNPEGMWDEEDGFYYDLLRFPDGSSTRLKVRSMVGLLPLCATTIIEKWQRELNPDITAEIYTRFKQMPALMDAIHPTGPGHLGVAERGICALVNPERLRKILTKLLDEREFLSPYGIRSLSKFHQEQPYAFKFDGYEYRVNYMPAESDTGMFGGNSNWRGPIWMPVNVMIIRALLHFYSYYGDRFKIECPTGSGRMMDLFDVSKEIADRLTRLFLRNERGERPVFGGADTFQKDAHWRDYLLFYEYFHGDNGSGIGASHQTGWTGLIAKLIQMFGYLDKQKILEGGRAAMFNPRMTEKPDAARANP